MEQKLKPFLRWAGGKTRLVNELEKRVPDDFEIYCEPFLGAGSLLLRLKPPVISISDLNISLMRTWTSLKYEIDEIVECVSKLLLLDSRSNYEKLRDEFDELAKYLPARKNIDRFPGESFLSREYGKHASVFIYLNKTGFNGLYRTNSKGEFNVPWVKRKIRLNERNLRGVSDYLLSTQMIAQACSFTDNSYIRNSGSGCFFYLDPPYYNRFSGYNPSGFSIDDHKRLANVCKEINIRDSKFMLSINDTPFTRDIYKGFNIEEVQTRRTISADPTKRGKETELIIRNYE